MVTSRDRSNKLLFHVGEIKVGLWVDISDPVEQRENDTRDMGICLEEEKAIILPNGGLVCGLEPP